MTPVLLLLCVFLAPQASEAETMFVKTGEDLRLAGPGPVDLKQDEQLFWRYNRTTSIVRLSPGGEPLIFSEYRGRAEFVKETHSLLVKRVNHGDSGDYTAVIAESEERDIARYRVQVLDPVSPVQLRVVSISERENTCVLNVTCGPINSSFTNNCKTFSQDGGQQEVNLSGSTYRIYHQNSNIICNHSNQVSWTNDTVAVRAHCALVCRGPFPIWLVTLIAVLFVVCDLTCGIVCYKKQRNKKTSEEQGEQVYDQPEDSSPSNRTEPESGPSPDSTYALVEFHTGPSRPAPEQEVLWPETLYAQVDKVRRSRDSARHRL
ncbi:SLAM family member 5-like [Synchiropus picturatus]